MPKMDGLEASAQIRNEAGSSFKTPIIAVTADATEETKSLLIKSDLDDYLVKPVCEKDLRTIMKKWCFQNNELDCHNVSSKQLPKMAESDHDPVDRAMGIKLASGNEDLWKQSLKNLASQLPTQKKQLEQAFETGDIAKLNQLAHSIIGTASYCGATELLNASKKFKALVSEAEVTSINDEFLHLIFTISRTVRWINTSNL